jgi:hypothetical protein
MRTFNKIEAWAEANKFWSEIVKTIILGTLGTLLVAFVIDQLKDRLSYSSEVAKSQVGFKADVIKEFADKSYKFTSYSVRYKETKKLGHLRDSLAQLELRDRYDAYRSVENQLNLVLNNTDDSISAEKISKDMLLLITSRDSLLKACFSYDSVRNRIKTTSNIVEVNCFKRLKKYSE